MLRILTSLTRRPRISVSVSLHWLCFCMMHLSQHNSGQRQQLWQPLFWCVLENPANGWSQEDRKCVLWRTRDQVRTVAFTASGGLWVCVAGSEECFWQRKGVGSCVHGVVAFFEGMVSEADVAHWTDWAFAEWQVDSWCWRAAVFKHARTPHTHTHIYTHSCAHSLRHTHTGTHTHIYTHSCAHSLTHTHTFTHTQLCTLTQTHTGTHTHIYTHSYAHSLRHTHTFTHTHTHTYRTLVYIFGAAQSWLNFLQKMKGFFTVVSWFVKIRPVGLWMGNSHRLSPGISPLLSQHHPYCPNVLYCWR